MRKCKISVVMTVYNGREYLRQAVESVLKQSYNNIELIIVVEHGCEKEIIKVVESYAHQNEKIIIVYNHTHLGIAASLNKGIDIATGEYIARMDADDICMKSRLQTQLAFLESHMDISVAGTDVEFINKKGKSLNRKDGYPQNHVNIQAQLLFHCCVRHPTVMFRKADFDRLGLRYNEKFTAAEDYELWCRAIGKLKFVNIPQVLLLYRWYKENATHTNHEKGEENYIEVMKKMYSDMSMDYTLDEIRMLCPMTSRVSLGCVRKYKSLSKDFCIKVRAYNKNHHLFSEKALEEAINTRFYHNKKKCRFTIVVVLRSIINFAPIRKMRDFNSLLNCIELNGFIKTIKQIIGKLYFQREKVNFSKINF